MSPPNFTAKSSIPIYAVALPRNEVIVYSGGGGRGRSGVTNAIRAIEIVVGEAELVDKAEVALSRDEDAPMCMALAPVENSIAQEEGQREEDMSKMGNLESNHMKIICGVNSNETTLASGTNENVCVFEWNRSGPSQARVEEEAEQVLDTGAKEALIKQQEVRHNLGLVSRHKSLDICDPEHYIKVVKASPDGALLAVGGTDGQFALHVIPSLEKLWSVKPPNASSMGVVDIDFSADSSLIALVRGDEIQIYTTAIAANASSKGGTGSLQPDVHQTIGNPSLKGAIGCTFRSARFGRNRAGGRSDRLYTVVNASPEEGFGSSKKDRQRARIRKCFVSAWDTGSWELMRTRQVAERPATAMEMSPTGRHIALSTSDLSLHLFSTRTLRTVWTLRDAHAFPSTCLAFSPAGDRIVSGSADMSLRIVSVGANADSRLIHNWLNGKLATILLAICLAVFALYLQNYLAPGLPLEGSGEEG